MPEESERGRRESGRAREIVVRALWLLRENADRERRRIRLSQEEAAFLGLPEPWFRKAAAKPLGRASSSGLALADFAGGVDRLLRKQGAALPIEPGFLGRPAKSADEFNAQVKALRRALRAVLDETPPAHSPAPDREAGRRMEPSSDLGLRAEGRAARSHSTLLMALSQSKGNVERAAAPPEGAPAARKRAQPRSRARECDRRALDSFRWALHGMGNPKPTMDQVYSYLADRKCPLYDTPRWRWPGLRRRLPDLETWKRYVRKARQAESPDHP